MNMKRFKSLKNSLTKKSNSPLVVSLLFLSIVFAASAGFSYMYIFSRMPSQTSYNALGLKSITRSTQVSAFIGEFRFSLTGYTSPYARVIFEGQGIFDETFADKYGKFTFLNRFSPLSSREACLTAHDTDGRSTRPLCLPPFSVKKNVVIGPVLLPPTVSVTQDVYLVHDYGGLSGKAAPDSSVAIDLYSDNTKIPLTTYTDASGDYSISLPTEREKTLRAYSINHYADLISDKSTTLTMHILPVWQYILKSLTLIARYLKDFALPLILLVECLILVGLFLWGRHHSYPLMIRPESRLDVRPKDSRQ